MAKIAVLGHGVVGSGVVELCHKNHAGIVKKAGQEVEVKRILDLREFPDLPYADKFTKNYDDILNDDEISVVVEVMGGLNPAYEYVKAALSRKKSVVTSNKELVAAKGAELLAVAKENNVNFFFEASVGGGIPIIRPLHQCLAANEIKEIAGILNGTTNFILTKMIREQMSFEDALKLAQQLGYAERNPAADVEGADACRKICILASLAYGMHVYPENVYTEGITKITLEDVAYADSWGGVIKLIGRAKALDDGKLLVMVHPAFISSDSQLAGIDDVFNGIMVRGDATGDVVFYGKGAGKLPTASAVVADVIDVIKATKTNPTLTWVDTHENVVVDHMQTSVAFYIRCVAADGAFAEKLAEQCFGKVQMLSRPDMPREEIAFVTPELSEQKVYDSIQYLKENNVDVLSAIRVLDY